MGLGSIMKQAQEIGGKMKEMNEELKGVRIKGSAGAGMVEIEANGQMEFLSCRIDPKLIADGDQELLEDMVTTAANDAIAKARQAHSEAMQSVTGGMDLPGLQEAMDKMQHPTT
jgi:hypothetical protein